MVGIELRCVSVVCRLRRRLLLRGLSVNLRLGQAGGYIDRRGSSGLLPTEWFEERELALLRAGNALTVGEDIKRRLADPLTYGWCPRDRGIGERRSVSRRRSPATASSAANGVQAKQPEPDPVPDSGATAIFVFASVCAVFLATVLSSVSAGIDRNNVTY